MGKKRNLQVHDKRRASSTQLRGGYRDDPFYKRRGSFKGPKDLSARHDKYPYRSALPTAPALRSWSA